MFIASETKHKDGSYTYFYKCSSRKYGDKRCVGSTVRVDVLDKFIVMKLTELLMQPEKITEYLEHYKKVDPTIADRKGMEKVAQENERLIRNTTRAITQMDDEDVAATLMVELKSLQERKRKIDADRDHLNAIHERWENQQIEVRDISFLMNAKLAIFRMHTRTYEQMRTLIDLFGIKATVYHFTQETRFTVEMDIRVEEVFATSDNIISKTLMEMNPANKKRAKHLMAGLDKTNQEQIAAFGGEENIPQDDEEGINSFDDIPYWRERKKNLLTGKEKKSSIVSQSACSPRSPCRRRASPRRGPRRH